jgi:hypothetical protein
MEIGNKVTWNGHVGVITDIVKPKCKCKGQGHYVIDVNGVLNKIPLNTKLELYESIGIIGANITSHKL